MYHPATHSTTARITPWLIGLSISFSGCGYVAGSFHARDVRTIAVPVFENDSTRRGIELMLTEAVQDEIKTRTPYRLAKEPYADTKLRGRIVQIRKRSLGETRTDDPRELQYSLAVEVIWEDLRTGTVLAEQSIPINPVGLHLESNATFAPEVGQSQATATHQAVERLAAQIVDRMEAPW
ncbi:MAG TPA: LptE family protein [Planctomycetaceae bacterium]|nr:LptE family protein [Planctomycetaceae bacterium]